MQSQMIESHDPIEKLASDCRLTDRQAASKAIEKLHGWLIDSALPFWCRHGVDWRNGGFHESLNADGEPIESPRRTRCIARQIYAFSAGHELGWQGDSAALVSHGLEFLQRHLVNHDGNVAMGVELPEATLNNHHDPYDYACVLFALAQVNRQSPQANQHADELAARIRNRLFKDWRHQDAGFREDPHERHYLRANPHMHLLEAFLAWEELAKEQDRSWAAESDKIAELALNRLIDKQTGAISEFFNNNWLPEKELKDQTIEPGHLFEWSWLLSEWGRRRNSEQALKHALELTCLGEKHGIDLIRGVAINSLEGTFSPLNKKARLWPQTERIKAWHAILHSPELSCEQRENAERSLILAIAGLQAYFKTSPLGSWHEEMNLNGQFSAKPMQASGLYHLTLTVHTLVKCQDQA